MASALPSPDDCCQESCACPTEAVPIPGPQGPAGAAGADGLEGLNAFTNIIGPLVAIPAALASTDINVEDSASLVMGQVIYIGFAGYYLINNIVSAQKINGQNLGYPGNAGAGPNFTIGARVSPGGLQGPSGGLGGPAGGQLSGTYPNPSLAITVAKGDVIVNNGAGNVALTVGANGTRLTADSTQATGVKWDRVNLNVAAEVNGQLGVANGGTGLAVGTSGGILGFTAAGVAASSVALTNFNLVIGKGAGATPVPLGTVGNAGEVLTSQGAGLLPIWQAPVGGVGYSVLTGVGSPQGVVVGILGQLYTQQDAPGTIWVNLDGNLLWGP